MNALQVAGWYGGSMVASARKNTGVSILEQAVREPLTVLNNARKGIRDDAKRIQRAGVWGGVIGAAAAMSSAPCAPILMPMALAARGANACESTMGAVCTGVAAYSLSALMFTHAPQVAVGWSIFEWCAFAGRLKENADRRVARERQKTKRT